jgi:hypothetical protein
MRSAHKQGRTAGYLEEQLRLLRIDKAAEVPGTFTKPPTCQ